ncbi:MAG: hypothetical protein A2659_00900 [Candidatus Yanofskybacteria bacterium RIFCSPHIGHO2_01_FULL_44_24]|nr:MAG: hypothetical protein A2659_00900 [Candidatus Yanofskybacteria bacterium RIFCSPHIGHO2_01_FULL_44_24]
MILYCSLCIHKQRRQEVRKTVLFIVVALIVSIPNIIFAQERTNPNDQNPSSQGQAVKRPPQKQPDNPPPPRRANPNQPSSRQRTVQNPPPRQHAVPRPPQRPQPPQNQQIRPQPQRRDNLRDSIMWGWYGGWNRYDPRYRRPYPPRPSIWICVPGHWVLDRYGYRVWVHGRCNIPNHRHDLYFYYGYR